MAGSPDSFIMSDLFPPEPPVTSSACYFAGLQLGPLLFLDCWNRNERTTGLSSCNQSWVGIETRALRVGHACCTLSRNNMATADGRCCLT